MVRKESLSHSGLLKQLDVRKREFNPKYVKTAKGTFKIGASTTKMTTNDFIEYVMRIQQWADENGVFIPDPQEYKGPEFIDGEYE
jgi:hypothetical protein